MVFQSFLFGLIAAFAIGLGDLLAAAISRRIGVYRVLMATHVVSVVLSTIYLPFAFDFSGVSPGDWLDLFLLSILAIVTLTALYKALQIGPVAVVSPIVATPVAAILLAVVVGGERLTDGQVIGIAITATGVAMTSVDIRELHSGRRLIGTGASLAFATMLGGGIWVYRMGSLSQKLGWFLPVYLNKVITMAILAPIQMRGRMWKWQGLTVRTGQSMVLLGVLETAALFAFARGAEIGAISIVAATFSVYPLVPIAGGLLIFKERLAPNQIVGLAIVFTGLITLGAMT